MSVRRRFGLRVERHVRRRRGPADDERRGGATERRSKHAATGWHMRDGSRRNVSVSGKAPASTYSPTRSHNSAAASGVDSVGMSS